MIDVAHCGSHRKPLFESGVADREIPFGIIITAIPAGKNWRLKILDPSGSVAYLPDIFSTRLETLGAGVILADRCNGQVIP